MKRNKFTTQHFYSLRDRDIYFSIKWDYYPGWGGNYWEPPEPESIELVDVQLPDNLESRKEEVEGIIDEDLEHFEEEAFEQIHDIFQQWREPNDY